MQETVVAPSVGANSFFDDFEESQWDLYSAENVEQLEAEEDMVRERAEIVGDEDEVLSAVCRYRRQTRQNHRDEVWRLWTDRGESHDQNAEPDHRDGRISELESRLWRLEAERIYLEASRDELIGQLGKMEVENDRLKTDRDELADEADDLRDENETLHEDVARLMGLTDQERNKGSQRAAELLQSIRQEREANAEATEALNQAHYQIQHLEARAANYGIPEPCPCGGLTVGCMRCGRML